MTGSAGLDESGDMPERRFRLPVGVIQVITPGAAGFASARELRCRDYIRLVLPLPRGRALVVARKVSL